MMTHVTLQNHILPFRFTPTLFNSLSLLPSPSSLCRCSYFAFCTRGKVTAAQNSEERVAWLHEAQTLATAFCAAAHGGGIITRVKLEQWWAEQVHRAGTTEDGSRSSLTPAVAQALAGGGLGRLDCGLLLQGGSMLTDAARRAVAEALPAPAQRGGRRNAANANANGAVAVPPALPLVPVLSTAAQGQGQGQAQGQAPVERCPPDVFLPASSAAAASSAKLALAKLADTGRRLAPFIGRWMTGGGAHNRASNYASLLQGKGLTVAYEIEAMRKHAIKGTDAGTAAAAGGLRPSLADRRFWANHARMTAGGRAVETSIDPSVLPAMQVALLVGVPHAPQRPAEITFEGTTEKLVRDVSPVEAEEKFAGVYRDDKNSE